MLEWGKTIVRTKGRHLCDQATSLHKQDNNLNWKIQFLCWFAIENCVCCELYHHNLYSIGANRRNLSIGMFVHLNEWRIAKIAKFLSIDRTQPRVVVLVYLEIHCHRQRIRMNIHIDEAFERSMSSSPQFCLTNQATRQRLTTICYSAAQNTHTEVWSANDKNECQCTRSSDPYCTVFSWWRQHLHEQRPRSATMY